jgi:hypothetical protein
MPETKEKTAIELLNIIYPRHDRSSCNDDNLDNGFYSRNSDGFGRCTRCMHIELISGEDMPPKVKEAHDSGDSYALRG